jgi:hypothetical protein
VLWQQALQEGHRVAEFWVQDVYREEICMMHHENTGHSRSRSMTHVIPDS